MREPFHPSTEQLSLPDILAALGDPARLKILASLENQGETNCGGCSLEMQKSAKSHHFKVLREAGLIRVRIEGTHRILSIRKADIESRFPGLLAGVLANIPGEGSCAGSNGER